MFTAAGKSAAASSAVYVEDVFSTWLYTGNGSTQTITNGIDLSGKGGMVWVKSRNNSNNHAIADTARGTGKIILPNLTNGELSNAAYLPSFNSNGFAVQDGGGDVFNASAYTYASWTFREQAKFFDVVTYTGDGNTSKTINHNLGSTPGCIIVKNLSSSLNWFVYHTSIGATKHLNLNTTSGATTSSASWNDTAPTSTQFTVGANSNTASNNYVAYLFAHDAGGFGAAGTDNVISCGSYTGAYPSNVTVNLGFEPQFIMVKNATQASDWFIYDTMRGMDYTSGKSLAPNSSAAENGVSGNAHAFSPTATGFIVESGLTAVNVSGNTHIYIAIRRGPMKTPTSGTSVFTPSVRASGTGAAFNLTGTGFPPDLLISTERTNVSGLLEKGFHDRLRGNVILRSNTTAAEATDTPGVTAYGQDGFSFGADGSYATVNFSGASYVYWAFRRAPGFFDEVVITTNGQASPITSTHNLGVVPEMMIAKKRGPTGGVGDWMVYHKDLNGGVTPQNYRIRLNSTGGEGASSGVWNNTAPTATQFTIGTDSDVNSGTAGDTTVFYLFASVAGVSKVGSYTGTGALQTINCGFAAGARFVLIKRRDATGGDWWVYDSARGITSGNDPYLFLNSTAAEVTGTNYVDTASTGFQVTAAAPAGLNANGGTYIFLAIA